MRNRRKGGLTVYGFGYFGTGRSGPVWFPDMSGKPWYEQLYLARQGLSPAQTIPQELADSWTEIIEQACRWFHDPNFKFMPAYDYIDLATDAEVEQRIAGYQKGYDKEYNRRVRLNKEVWYSFFDNTKQIGNLRYDFESMPLSLKRAIVSRWDEAHYKYLQEHNLNYDPEIGYYWLIEGFKVKYLPADKGQMPTESTANPYSVWYA